MFYRDVVRTSSCAIVCIDDAPRILIDAGGGAFARVGQAGLDLHTFENFALDVAEQPNDPALDAYPVTVGIARLAGVEVHVNALSA